VLRLVAAGRYRLPHGHLLAPAPDDACGAARRVLSSARAVPRISKALKMKISSLVLREVGDLLGVLSHPARLHMALELRRGERDVNALASAVGVAPSTASQHLSVLRAHTIALERREGRHVFYRLARPELADWLREGLRFIVPTRGEELREAVEDARLALAPQRRGGRRRRVGVGGGT